MIQAGAFVSGMAQEHWRRLGQGKCTSSTINCEAAKKFEARWKRPSKNALRNLKSVRNQRLYISLIDKVGGTIKDTVWSSHTHDGVGYLFAVLKVAVEPDEREWTKRSSAFFELPEILATAHTYLEQAFLQWIEVATEVIYSTRFTAEAVKKHLGQFLRHYPDLIATVDQIWQGLGSHGAIRVRVTRSN